METGLWQAVTRATYETHLRSVWRKRIGYLKLRDLRKHHIEEALRDVAIRTGGAERMPRTLRSHRATLRASLTAAVDAGYLNENPAAGNPKALPAARKAELKMWQPAELRLFLAVTADKRDARLWRVAAFTGLRRAELCGMRWMDVDMDGEHPGLTIRQTVPALAGEHACLVCGGSHRGCFIKTSPKSDAGARWVPLVTESVTALRQHKNLQDQVRAVWGDSYSDHGLVFCQDDGAPLVPGSLTMRFKTLVDSVRHPMDPTFRLPLIRPHDMRHGAASMMIAAGVPIETVSLILGHSSPAVTRQICTHVLRGPATAAVEAAAALVREDGRAQFVHSHFASSGQEEVSETLQSRSSEASDPAAGLDDYCMTNSVR